MKIKVAYSSKTWASIHQAAGDNNPKHNDLDTAMRTSNNAL
jgi:hypothetical protein